MNPMSKAIPAPPLQPAPPPAGAKPGRDVRAQYEDSPEYRLGCAIIDELTETLGIDAEEASAMLSLDTRPLSGDLLGREAAGTLTRMKKDGKLNREIDAYLADEGFIKLLREVPAAAAVRLSDAELNAKSAHSEGMQEVLEKLRTRSALPRQTPVKATASAAPNFNTMSEQEFDAFKRRYFSGR